MVRMLSACLVLVSGVAFADASQGINSNSPHTMFSTHKTAEVFAQCMSDASVREFPATRVEAEKTGKVISVIRAPDADPVAVIDVEEGKGGGSMVIIRTATRAQPAKNPAVKLARNCQ